MAAKFLNVGDCYAGYRDVVTGEYTDSEFSIAWNQAQIIEACANGGEYVGDANDPRLVAEYVTAGVYEHGEDAYVPDVLTSKSGIVPEDKQYAGHYGYDVVPAPAHIVRCWYCNEEFTFYRDWFGKDDASAKQGFVVAMLVHYYEHRSGTVQPGTPDLPYVTTYFPGREIVTPSGKVYTKPGVVRTWRINGKLLND